MSCHTKCEARLSLRSFTGYDNQVRLLQTSLFIESLHTGLGSCRDTSNCGILNHYLV
ncbi:Uncharacterised protein [Segatella copri]|nr:Uncharacterised protein [Segatella copri]